jgi:beta-phosphoglucomutase-like phosphatase (HAD superfamily)
MVDAVLLEWEGVLADTAVARRDALARALAEEGVQLDALRSDPVLATLVAMRASRAFAERLGKGFVLLPGARAFVEHAQIGSMLGIVTSATRAETEFVLRLSGLDAAVSTIVSADDGLDAPPSPATTARAVEQLARRRALRRDRIVSLGATSPALRGARTAGVHTIAVGAPAHVAVDADGAVNAIAGLTLADIARLCGITTLERRS